MSQQFLLNTPAVGNPRAPSIAFIGWNPFQIRHILGIAQKLENSCIIIEKRKDHIFKFDEELLTESGVPIIIWAKNRIGELDGLFDVIVCQTPFSQMELITKSRIAMIQYGYAKEGHNYGSWRSRADLCLVYGDYAAEKLRPLCPVVITGNPAMDPWHTEEFHLAARKKYSSFIDTSKKTILYAPTWGDLSTIEIYLEEVMKLSQNYNLLLKLHHTTDLLGNKKKLGLKNLNPIYLGANHNLLDLIAVSDVLLSDYSGAIFDAMYCAKPVVLLHSKSLQRFGDKLNADSIEFSARHRIGSVLEWPTQLEKTILDLFEGNIDYGESNKSLIKHLYMPGPCSVDRSIAALTDLALREVI
jgi:CDP-Glycerol:Poly(glycerophosphate) glycerophosphotransferase